MKNLLQIAVLLLLTSCAQLKPIPFNTVSYSGGPSRTSDLNIALVLKTGEVSGARGEFTTGTGIVIRDGPAPFLFFHAQNQLEFMDVLKSELVRLRTFRSISLVQSASSDARVTINFVRTFHRPRDQEYILDLTMQIDGGNSLIQKTYKISSHERSTNWERWNTNPYQGKVLAVKELLEKIVPDIKAFATNNAKPELIR